MTETAQTVKDVVDTLMPYLQQAAEQLGTTAAYLWMLQVKQAYVLGATYLIQYVLYGLILYGIYRFAKWMLEKVNPERYDEKYRYQVQDGLAFLGGIASFIIAIVCIVNVLSSVHTVLTLLFNPEYWALNEVISLLKGSVKF